MRADMGLSKRRRKIHFRLGTDHPLQGRSGYGPTLTSRSREQSPLTELSDSRRLRCTRQAHDNVAAALAAYPHERPNEASPSVVARIQTHKRATVPSPVRRAFEEDDTGTAGFVRCAASGLAPMRFLPASYFCTCWNVIPSPSASLSWLIPSIIRRIRIRPPTCLSTGLGVPPPSFGCFTIPPNDCPSVRALRSGHASLALRIGRRV